MWNASGSVWAVWGTRKGGGILGLHGRWWCKGFLVWPTLVTRRDGEQGALAVCARTFQCMGLKDAV